MPFMMKRGVPEQPRIAEPIDTRSWTSATNGSAITYMRMGTIGTTTATYATRYSLI